MRDECQTLPCLSLPGHPTKMNTELHDMFLEVQSVAKLAAGHLYKPA